ncbi:MAG: ImmA/IrrE family metallo-endopeptidase [Proteobacteria bacterium]|nr:ImmA/IrrE family metallo-endopeptidase [Pseudomonadota bacterium]
MSDFPQRAGARITPITRKLIEKFQSYVVRQYYEKSPKWRHSRQLIQEVAESFARHSHSMVPPVNPIATAKLLGLTLEFRKGVANDPCGRIVPMQGGFQATIFRATDDPTIENRARFTIAHECGHVLFFSLDDPLPHRIIPRASGNGGLFWREEGLCDSFAGALLMPRNLLEETPPKLDRVDVLFSLASRFQVSTEVVVRRVLHDLRLWDMNVIYRVGSKDGAVSVTIYRGSCRKSYRDPAPTGNRLAAKLNENSSCNLLGQLMHTLGVCEECIGFKGGSHWVIV